MAGERWVILPRSNQILEIGTLIHTWMVFFSQEWVLSSVRESVSTERRTSVTGFCSHSIAGVRNFDSSVMVASSVITHSDVHQLLALTKLLCVAHLKQHLLLWPISLSIKAFLSNPSLLVPASILWLMSSNRSWTSACCSSCHWTTITSTYGWKWCFLWFCS